MPSIAFNLKLIPNHGVLRSKIPVRDNKCLLENDDLKARYYNLRALLFYIVRAHKSAPKMHSSFPTTSAISSSIFNPSSSVISTQSPVEYLHFDEQGRSPQFSSSFSIRAILSSSSNSSPQAQSFPSYGQLLLTGDVGAFECSAPFPHHHCCHQGVRAVNWQTDKGASVKTVINTPFKF